MIPLYKNSKIEKLVNALMDHFNTIRSPDGSVPAEWQDLDNLAHDCQRDIRKFGAESLLEPDDNNTVELKNGGCLEWEDDGTIRYTDADGNSEGVWHPVDKEYDQYKKQYFPLHVAIEEDWPEPDFDPIGMNPDPHLCGLP